MAQSMIFAPRVTMIGSRAGRCPKCGGEGLVPDGEYTPFNAKIRHPEQAVAVERALNILRKHIAERSPSGEVFEDLSKNGLIPDGMRPKTLQDWLSYASLLVAVLTLLLTEFNNDEPVVHPAVDVNVIQIVQQIIEFTPPAEIDEKQVPREVRVNETGTCDGEE